MEEIWKPDRKFVKEVVNFPGASLNHFYGKRTIPDSYYITFRNKWNKRNKERPQPYLLGMDNRRPYDVLEALKKTTALATEMLDSTFTVNYPFGEDMIYIGKPECVRIEIAKELILPESFRALVKKRDLAESKEPRQSLPTSILTGRFFSEIEEYEAFERKLAGILEREGMRLGDKTVIDISLDCFGEVYPHTLELMNSAANELKDRYTLQKMQDMFIFSEDGYGNLRADIHDLKADQGMFIGELKKLEKALPCGKMYKEKLKEIEHLKKKFESEKKRGMHRDKIRKELIELDGITASGTSYEPSILNLPCGIDGRESCAIKWCKQSGRGIIEKKIS